MNLHDESGQVLPMVTVMALGLLAMVGLVIDAGTMFAAKRDLQATADAAARAGATVIDEDAYRSSGGRRVVLDEAAAHTLLNLLAILERICEVEIKPLRRSPAR